MDGFKFEVRLTLRSHFSGHNWPCNHIKHAAAHVRPPGLTRNKNRKPSKESPSVNSVVEPTMRQMALPKSHTVTFGIASHSMPFGDHHPMPVTHPVKPRKRSHLEPVAASCSWDISSMSPISSWCAPIPLKNGSWVPMIPFKNGSCKSCSP